MNYWIMVKEIDLYEIFPKAKGIRYPMRIPRKKKPKKETKKTASKATPKKQHAHVEKKQEPVAEQLTDVIPVKPEEPPKEEMVSYVIPKDPGLEATDQFFEININGINYRFARGEVLTHPKGFYQFIAYKLSLRENVSPLVAEFKDKSKRLNM